MSVLNSSALEAIRRGDQWLDGEVGQAYKEQPLAQDYARTLKVIEEIGETLKALILATGQNPRKMASYRPASETDLAELRHMLTELGDSAAACLLGIQHWTKDTEQTDEILAQALVKVRSRAEEAGY
ncbi:MAG TPA: hypothetical protein VEV45_20625 [Streptosporangiaceae bacterium]|nr:hypothetical protein [Streptosporangiaceae bacterium]